MLRHEAQIEKLLRSARPEAPATLVDSIALRCAPPSRRRRLVAAAAFSAAVLAALAAVGGMGQAASYVRQAVADSPIHQAFVKTQTTLALETQNAALDQYAPPEPTPAPTPTPEPTPEPTDEVVVAVPAGTPGTVNVIPAGGSAPASVSWGPGTFPSDVVIVIDPTPPLASTALVGLGNQLLSVRVLTPAGEPFTGRLGAPLEILFRDPPAGFAPVISTDGINFRAVPQIAGLPMPESLDDAYYVDPDGNVHMLTRHVTVFAVVYRANVTLSESGRRLKQAGSGLFGDPTRIHVGPPVVREVPRQAGPVKLRRKRGYSVPFAFFVDEQAAVVISVFDRDRKLLLAMEGSSYRGRPLRGAARKNLKVVVVRPGRIGMTVRVPGRLLEPRKTYRIRVWAVDYDGNRVIRFIPFRAP